MVLSIYFKRLLVLVTLLILFFLPEYVSAQGTCNEYGSSRRVPVYVYDELGRKWGQDTEICSPPVQTSVRFGESAPRPNYVRSIEWRCSISGREGVFAVQTEKGCTSGPMSITMAAPQGYECSTWQYLGISGGYGSTANNEYGSGTGCTATFPIPPGDWQRQVIMQIAPAQPIGFFDYSSCNAPPAYPNGTVMGWTCDPSDFNATVEVQLWADNVNDAAGYFRVPGGPYSANQNRPDPGVANDCGGNPNHGFSFPLPDSLKDGRTYDLRIVAIDTTSGNGIILRNGPQRISCGASCIRPSGLTYPNPPTCTSDTTPALSVRSQGVNCYPHDLYYGIYRDLNGDNTHDGFVAGGNEFNNVLGANLATYTTSSYTLPEGTYMWRGRAWNSVDGQQGPDDPWNRFEIDTTGPTRSTLTMTCRQSATPGQFTVTGNWTAATDARCGLDASGYIMQLSTNSLFSSILYPGSWQSSTTHTTSSTYAAGTTIYGRVNTRDSAASAENITTGTVSGPLTLGCGVCNCASATIVPNHLLSVQAINAGGGVLITGSSSLYGGTTNYTVSVIDSSSFTLTAPATVNGRSFESWTGCSSVGGTGNRTCTITNMTAPRTVTATYILPDCTVAEPAPTISCESVSGSTQYFNTTLTWTPRWNGTPGVTCRIPATPQTFTAELSSQSSFPAGSTRSASASSPYTFSSVSANTNISSPTPDTFGRVTASHGATILTSPSVGINLGCSNLPDTDLRYGACGGCPALPPGPVVGGLRYCPEPPTL